MRCLVTGGSGFLGQHVIDWLRLQRYEVWAIAHDEPLGHSDLHTVRGSIEDLGCCERATVESRADVVFHLAAQAIVPHARRNPLATLETNVRGTYNMLEAFRRHRTDDAVMIVASSDKAYGNTGIGGVYHENSPMRGRGPYDVSKSCADLIAQSYGYEFSLPIGIVRAGNIYGPGDSDMTRIVPSVASAIAMHRAPVLTSDGSPVRDYLYVSDAVAAYVRLMEHIRGSKGHQAFNFSGGRPVSAMELAELAVRVDGGGLKPQVLGTRMGEIQRQALDSSFARKTLGWSPRVTLEEGLKSTIGWWRLGRRVQ